MSLFQRKAEEERSIEEILTPKSEVEEAERELPSNEILEDGETKVEIEGITDKALDCFGWKDVKTEKWLVKSAKLWYGVMSFCWFVLGAFTFAPIIFISSKINVIFKNKKKSLLASFGIYAVIVIAIVLMIVTRNNNSVTP